MGLEVINNTWFETETQNGYRASDKRGLEERLSAAW